MLAKKAGCILMNLDTKKIALVCRKGEFSFPKGHLESGENLQECAIRETVEETGHDCYVINNKEIAIMHYTSSRGEEVENYFYLAIDKGKSRQIIDENDKEETVWKEFDEVEDTLSYQNLKELWNKIKNEVKKILYKER